MFVNTELEIQTTCVYSQTRGRTSSPMTRVGKVCAQGVKDRLLLHLICPLVLVSSRVDYSLSKDGSYNYNRHITGCSYNSIQFVFFLSSKTVKSNNNNNK